MFRRYFPIFAIGLASAIALPPLGQVWILFLVFPYLLSVVEREDSLKRIFFIGWWFGFGHFMAGLYWISISLLVDPEKFAWLIPFAISLIPAAAGVYIGLVCVSTKLMRLSPILMPFGFAASWSSFEWLRGHIIFGGFPWNLIGYSWEKFLPILQVNSLVGIYGLGFITVLYCILPVWFFKLKNVEVAVRYSGIFASLFVFAGILVYGQGRLESNPEKSRDDVKIRIVQPNITQALKWDPALKMQHVKDISELSLNKLPSDTKMIVWPESAIPFLIASDSDVPPDVWNVTKDGAYVASGTVRGSDKQNDMRVWNSIQFFGPSKIEGSYDKEKLVPFGEYIPFRSFFPNLMHKVTGGGEDFSRGLGVQTKSLPNVPPFTPLVCYEVIYPGRIALEGVDKPEWILNATNDAWFGNSSGPYQHLEAGRIRAIEEGLPLVRAANTGVSAVIDAYGRMVLNLPLNEKGVLDFNLPEASHNRTLYSRYGDSPFAVVMAVTIVFSLAFRNKKFAKVS